MADIVSTTKENRGYYCANGWYYHRVQRKWARVTDELVKVIWLGKLYHYTKQSKTGLILSLNKKVWQKVRQDQVPLGVYNDLEN
jgi:hypothetical protein